MLLLSSRGSASPFEWVFLLIIAVVTVLASIGMIRKRREVYRAAGKELQLENLQVDGQSVSGDLRGMHVHVHEIPGGKSSPPHTQIDVAFSPCELMVELRRQDRSERRAVAAGEVIDVETGDPAFDEAWIVEGAPKEAVLAALSDSALRGRLLELREIEEGRVTIEDGVLTLFRRGSDIQGDALDLAHARLALDLAEAVRAVSQRPPSEEPLEVDEAAASYRRAPKVRPGETAAQKIEALKLKRAERRLDEARPLILAGHLLAPGIAAFVIARQGAEARQLTTLAIIGLVAQAAATGGSLVFLGGLRRSAPKVAFGAVDTVMIAGWLVLLAILAGLFLG